MLWRHLCLVRAITAAGLLTFSTLGAAAAGEPEEPIPGADAQAETVKVLEAERSGEIAVEVRGQGQDKVRVSLKNTSGKRLNVVLPPGLVASGAIGQGAAGGGGGAGGGFQNMGLGAATNRSGGFGQFAGNNSQPGFRSVTPSATADKPSTQPTPPSSPGSENCSPHCEKARWAPERCSRSRRFPKPLWPWLNGREADRTNSHGWGVLDEVARIDEFYQDRLRSMERWLTATEPAPCEHAPASLTPARLKSTPRFRRRLIGSDRVSGGRRMFPIVGFGLVFPYF